LRLAAWRDALRVLAAQFAALVVTALGAAAIFGWQAGLGAMIGASIALLANAYLAIAMLGKPLLTGKPGSMMLNWLVKAGLIIGLVTIALKLRIAPPLALIAGLAAVSLAQWIAVTFWLSGRR
jgi:hypothetical protein